MKTGIFVAILSLCGIIVLLFVACATKNQRFLEQQLQIDKTNQRADLMQAQNDHLFRVVCSIILQKAEAEEDDVQLCEFEKLLPGGYNLCLANYQTREALTTFYSPNKQEKTRFVRVSRIPWDVLEKWPWHEIKQIPLND